MSIDAWDQAREAVERHAAAGGIFVKLVNDGDKVCGCFVGQPYVREVVWTGERYEPADDDNPKHKGKRSSLRMAVNFYIPSQSVLKIIELSSSAIKDVFKVRDKYGFDSWTYEIERQGGPGDPKTKYRILPDEKIGAELRDELAELELHDLAALISGEGEDSDNRNDESAPLRGATTNEATVDLDTANELMASLKRLPKDMVQSFLKKFGIGRIRDLKARDVKAAHAFIEAARPKDSSGHDEIDPFA